MCSPPRAVLFDLDGTLVQTREASWRVFEKVSAAHDLGIDRPEQFYELFVDNFFVAIRKLCGTEALAETVEGEFLDGLRRDYSPLMIPGMADVVRALVPHATLAVLSSNTTPVVRRILRANSLEYCFAHVFGGDVEPDKAQGIRRFLDDAAQGSSRRCQAYYDEGDSGETIDPAATVLVTDTVGDVEAAVAAGIRPVGVAWGMHTEEQLLAAGAEFVAIWPQEIVAHLFARRHADAAACSCAQPAPTDLAADLAAAASVRTRRRRAAAAHQSAPARSASVAVEPVPSSELADAVRSILS